MLTPNMGTFKIWILLSYSATFFIFLINYILAKNEEKKVITKIKTNFTIANKNNKNELRSVKEFYNKSQRKNK